MGGASSATRLFTLSRDALSCARPYHYEVSSAQRHESQPIHEISWTAASSRGSTCRASEMNERLFRRFTLISSYQFRDKMRARLGEVHLKSQQHGIPTEVQE
jgi:hypothetical protein